MIKLYPDMPDELLEYISAAREANKLSQTAIDDQKKEWSLKYKTHVYKLIGKAAELNLSDEQIDRALEFVQTGT